MTDNDIKRVYFLTPRLVPVSGVAESFTTLAIELVRRGIEVKVFVRQPVRKDNQYRNRLQQHNIEVVGIPKVLGFFDKIDWGTRDRIIASLAYVVRLLFPLGILVDAFLRKRPFHRSWCGALGYINGVLAQRLMPILEKLPVYLDRYFYAQLDRWARKHPPDIVEVSGADFLRTITWGHTRRIPVVYKHCETATDWTPLQDAHLEMASCIIAKSESSKEVLLSMSKYQGPVFVIPNAFEQQLLLTKCDSVTAVEKGNNGVIRLIYIGRLNPEKGVQFLPEILKNVLSYTERVELFVVGRGPLMEQLMADFQDWGISGHVHFLGVRTHQETICALKDSDILVFPSLTEGLPNAIIEALACGKPIVATEIPGTKDLVTNGLEGFLVPPSEPGLMAEAIIKLIADEELRTRIGQTAYETFSQGSWSPEVLADRTLVAYHYAKEMSLRKQCPDFLGS